MIDHKLGPTGNFPRGKLNEDDEGELRIAISGPVKDIIRIDFGSPTAWIGLPTDLARDFANEILERCK